MSLVSLAALPSLVFGQASIAGVVRDTSGALLPGVTVETASPALIEKVRSSITDGGGQYRIENLRPGMYAVTFTLPGFSTVHREGVQLTGTFVATVNAELRVGALEETVTVTGETPTVDVQSTVRQRVLDQALLEVLPSNRTPGFAAALLPGLTRATHDVGGVSGENSGAGDITARGVTQSRLLMGGIPNLTSPGAPHKAYNLAAFQEVVVDSGGVGAEDREGGVRINVIPKDGGNTFSSYFLGAFANSAMQSSNFRQELKDRGLSTPDSLKQVTDVNPAFGGPLKQDTVWFHVTARHTRAWSYIPLFFNKNAGDPNAWTYEPDLTRGPVSTEGTIRAFNGRLTWQASQKHKLGFSYDVSDVCDCPRGLSAILAPEAGMGSYQSYKPPLSQFWGDWTVPFSNRVLYESTVYTQRAAFQRAEENVYFNPGPVPMIAVLEQSTGMTYRGTATVNDLFASTFYVRAAVSYITGAHALKVGFLGGIAQSDQVVRNVDAPMQFRFNNGVPNQVTIFARPHRNEADMNADHGLFVQDRWTVSRFTLTAGLRYDYFHLSFPEQSVGPTVFTPNRNLVFPKTEGARFHDISPRTGLAVDLFGNGKTALKVSSGKYPYGEHVAGTVFSNAAPLNLLVTDTSRSWNDANRNFAPDCDLVNAAANGECGPFANASFGLTRSGLALDPDVLSGWGKRGYNWQFALGVQHEIVPRVSLSADYWRTWYGNHLVTVNRSYTAADFDRFSITAPRDPRLPGGGGYVIDGLYDVKPSAFGRVNDGFVTVSDNFGKQTEHWNGIDFTLNARLRSGVLLQGGTSTQRQSTNNCDVVTHAGGVPPARGSGFPAYNPSQLYCNVPGTFLTQLKLLGSYTVPRIDVQMSASLQNLPGPEMAANFVASNAGVAPSLGRNLAGGVSNITVNLIEPRSMYGDRLNQLDLRLGKIFRFGRARVTTTVDIYNALNSAAVLTMSNAFATWQRPQSILTARFAKVGVQFNF
jgi:hypothetical protein